MKRERERTIDNRSKNNEQITFVRVTFFFEGERLLTDLEQCHYLVNPPPREREREKEHRPSKAMVTFSVLFES